MMQPRLNGARLWQRHVQKTSAILNRALAFLQLAETDENEDSLNRKFYFHLLRANREARGSPLGGFDHAPRTSAARSWPMQGVRSKKGFMISRTGDVGGEADDRVVDLGTQVTVT